MRIEVEGDFNRALLNLISGWISREPDDDDWDGFKSRDEAKRAALPYVKLLASVAMESIEKWSKFGSEIYDDSVLRNRFNASNEQVAALHFPKPEPLPNKWNLPKDTTLGEYLLARDMYEFKGRLPRLLVSHIESKVYRIAFANASAQGESVMLANPSSAFLALIGALPLALRESAMSDYWEEEREKRAMDAANCREDLSANWLANVDAEEEYQKCEERKKRRLTDAEEKDRQKGAES